MTERGNPPQSMGMDATLRRLIGLTSLLATGCITSTVSGPDGDGAGSSSSGVSAASSGTSAAASSGTTSAQSSAGSTQAAGASSAGSSTTGTGGSSTGATTGGSTTGIAVLPPIVDGGYVFCEWSGSPQGFARWQCDTGTYFCNLHGDAGSCLQCRSDEDCDNLALPTYDPNRLHCDRASGAHGYQGFCQQCVGDADCTGNLAGPVCNSNPPDPGTLPEIDILGFESCGGDTLDCRRPSARPAA